MATASATLAPVQAGLFDKKLPPRIILGSFFLLTAPLIALYAAASNHWFVTVYLWLFGLTHFVLTLSVYLQSENLKYFKATARNILLFFVVPPAILMGFYVTGVLRLNARFPVAAIALGVVIRTLDFNHLNRQTFGVYQLFKARTGLRPPGAIKNFEQAYLFSLTALLLTTFLAGGVCPLPQVRAWFEPGKRLIGFVPKATEAMLPLDVLQLAFVAFAALTIVLGAISVWLLIRAWDEGGRPRGIMEALGYMGIQTVSALFAVVSFPLYFATLATHYVEYHVLMYPRCFNVQLNDKSGLDRWFAGARRHRVVFYGMMILVAGVVLLLRAADRSPSSSLHYLAVVSIFDGLFVFHYFVEMLIWRFSNPFFRKSVGSLYFTPRLRAGQ
jgi:hypothetical protein